MSPGGRFFFLHDLVLIARRRKRSREIDKERMEKEKAQETTEPMSGAMVRNRDMMGCNEFLRFFFIGKKVVVWLIVEL